VQVGGDALAGLGLVHENHAAAAGLLHVVALGDARLHAAPADHDLAVERARRERIARAGRREVLGRALAARLGAEVAPLTILSVPVPPVMAVPTKVCGVATPGPVTPVSVVWKRRVWVAFAAAITHGALPGSETEPSSGPALPAATTGTMPAARTFNMALAWSAEPPPRTPCHGSARSPPIE
jgi:hypothetical protein